MVAKIELNAHHKTVLLAMHNGHETMAGIVEFMGRPRDRFDHVIVWLRRKRLIKNMGRTPRTDTPPVNIWWLTDAGREAIEAAIAEGFTPPPPPEPKARPMVFHQRRDPCVRCGVRGDIGCAHQPRDEGALLAA